MTGSVGGHDRSSAPGARQHLRVALAQLHARAGDLAGNAAQLLDAAHRAAADGVDILLAPEMHLTGYPIDDLLADPDFLDDVAVAAADLHHRLPAGMHVAYGLPMRRADLPAPVRRRLPDTHLDAQPRDLVNAVAVVRDGTVVTVAVKALLPTYGVFDDARWFAPGPQDGTVVTVAGVPTGIAVCEDVWTTRVIDHLAAAGAQVILAANASPYAEGKPAVREDLMVQHAARTGLPAAYVNAVGGQDEVVYDGGSFAVAADGRMLARAAAFTPALTVVDIPLPGSPASAGTATPPAPAQIAGLLDDDAATYRALVTGLRDYVHGSGLPGGVVIGLSGGLDSALAATIAVDALGPDLVRGVLMPGPYSSPHSITDAQQLADNLALTRVDILRIDAVHAAELAILGDRIAGPGSAIAAENIQARARALHLMSLANAHGAMVVNTGNKSEASVGYFTLGGDSSGGFAVLKDVYKTRAYQLARWRNDEAARHGQTPPIPASTLDKPPSAELAPDQQDTDSLPPYPVLDAILTGLLEDAVPRAVLARQMADRFDLPTGYGSWDVVISRVGSMIARSEHKRRQVAPGVKITARAYGRDRRYPIVNAYAH